MIAKYLVVLLVIIFLCYPSRLFCQTDSVSRLIALAVNVGCDAEEGVAIQEVSFIVLLHIDLGKRRVDGISVTGEIPSQCRLSGREAIARENKFATAYLNRQSINWSAWVRSLTATSCNKVTVLYPYVVAVPQSKGEPGDSFFKSALLPLFLNGQAVLPACTIFLKPKVIEWRMLRNEW